MLVEILSKHFKLVEKHIGKLEGILTFFIFFYVFGSCLDIKIWTWSFWIVAAILSGIAQLIFISKYKS